MTDDEINDDAETPNVGVHFASDGAIYEYGPQESDNVHRVTYKLPPLPEGITAQWGMSGNIRFLTSGGNSDEFTVTHIYAPKDDGETIDD